MKTEVIIVIDGSGSMLSKASDVRGGFNAYVEELRKAEGVDYSLSAVVFNTQTFPLFTQKPLKDVPELTEKNYAPGGNTALYDAIGKAIDEVKDSTSNFCTHCGERRATKDKFCSKCGNELGNGRSKFLLIIMTDGEENSSVTYRKHHIADKIKNKEAQGNWTVVYLGANQDAMKEGSALGVQQYNNLTYTVPETKVYYSALAGTTNAFAADLAPSAINFAAATASATTSGNFTPTVGFQTTVDNSIAANLIKEAAKGSRGIDKRRFSDFENKGGKK